MKTPRLVWDIGTAYDMFVSLGVLHNPGEFGVPGAWAAGVRARLPAEARATLEQAQSILTGVYEWVHSLPEPKDGATALWVLGRMQPAERLMALGLSPGLQEAVAGVLRQVVERRAWDDDDLSVLREHMHATCWDAKYTRNVLIELLEVWSRADEFGERYLEALRSYYDVFFAEEEGRIRPALAAALARAQELAGRMALPDLVEELSQGVRFVELPEVEELVLVPSYWCTPIIVFELTSGERAVWLFGAKPADASLVPGEVVPDVLLRTFKALSTPTRLRVLRYLAEEPLTPVQLSRRLRLRIPTVTHHLRTLRLAGLVQLTVERVEGKDRDVFALRFEALESALNGLKDFLRRDGDDG